ncbi:MAG TPA: RDD family protein [Steroidobacteraceae bacterium]|nr:RDD family protein [Steroidobacteraceae bacterium]
MNNSLVKRLSIAFLLLCATAAVHAESTASAAGVRDDATPSSPTPADEAERRPDEPETRDRHSHFDRSYRMELRKHRDRNDRDGNDLVSIGHDSTLTIGQQADAVVSILGSSTSAGDAADVVSILGNTRVSGPVRDTVVTVLGSTYIDAKVDGDAVAVIGDVELGPHAEIGGNLVAIFGAVRRDPAAIVHGGVQHIFGGDFGGFAWLHSWIKHCLLYGRPLALAPGLGWAWGLALGFLAFYVCLAYLCRESISRCVQTFETQPGQTLLAAIIAMLLSPVIIVLLCVTVIGIAAVPFVVVALWSAGLFGKAVMLAWLGGRITRRAAPGPLRSPAFAVLVGGAVVLASYLVPVLGFLVYKLLGILGLGAVVYTLILAARARQAARGNQGSAAFGSSRPASSGATSTDSSTAPIDGSAAPIDSSAAPIDASPPPAEPPLSAVPPASSAPPHVIASMPHAGFWIRMAALFLDVLLVGFVMSVLHGVFHMHLLLLAAYGAVMWKLRGSTVGGIVFDLKVVRLDGRQLDWETAIVRALGCFLSLAVAGLGFIWIAFDDANQAWHDKIAGTVVVRVPKGVPLV